MTHVNDPEMVELLNKLGKKIAAPLPEGIGFVLLLFDYGEGGNLFYISSAEREGIINVMKEFIKQNERPSGLGRRPI